MREYKAGDKIIQKGSTAEHIYVVAEGEAVVIDGKKVLATIEEGSIIGEMALVEKTVRSADVMLSVDSKVIEIEPT
jgi:CRP-like cAMP-binding protein